MKKIIALVLAHVIALVSIIVVIGAFSGRVEGEGKEKFDGVLERNVTLKVLENDTAIKQGYLKELITAFNKEYAEYNIEAIDAKMGEFTDLANNGPYGLGPDIVYQANDQLMRYVDGKHIMPLPVEDLEATPHISERAFSAFKRTVGGMDYTFAVPVNVQGPVLYYRKDLIPADWETKWDSNSNSVPDMLETWNSMYKFSQERKEKRAFGYMKSLNDQYFALGYLYSYGGYTFGNNNTDPKDIGHSKGDAEKGASVIRQLASIMNEGCIDDTITVNAYGKIGSGEYFATMTSPDVYTLFIDEIISKNGVSRQAAQEMLGATYIPMLPKSGDLSEENPELIPSRMMGGVNGYAVSSYTESPNASLAFIDFATKYEMIKRRNELLGIAPAREDVAKAVGGLSEVVTDNLNNGNIVIMPSIKENAQVWAPIGTFFADLAKDPFRKVNEQKYLSLAVIKEALKKADKQIFDAIFILK